MFVTLLSGVLGLVALSLVLLAEGGRVSKSVSEIGMVLGGLGLCVCTLTIVNGNLAAGMGHHFRASLLCIVLYWDTILLVCSYVYGWHWILALTILLKSIALPQVLCVQVSRLVTYSLGLEIGTRLSIASKRPIIYSGHPHNVVPLQIWWYHSQGVRIAVDPFMRNSLILCALL